MNKKVFIMRSILALTLTGALLVSCDKDEDKVLVSASALEGAPTASVNTVVISEDHLTEPALTLSWAKVTFTPKNTIAKSDIEISVAGGKTFVVPASELEKHTFTAKAINDILIDQLKVKSGEATPITFRARTYPYNGNSPAQPQGSSLAVSKAVTVTITPIEVGESPNFYFVGKGLGAKEWKEGYNGYPLFKDKSNAKEYTYTGKFSANAEFKFFLEEGLGNWSNAFGDEGGKIVKGKGGNIKAVTTEGYYTFTMNPTTGTYKVEPYAAGAKAPTYDKISLIGSSFGGWEVANDVLLEQSSYDPHIWSKANVEIKAGELKFRANQKWDTSWGGKETTFPAALSSKNDNIQVLPKYAGTYDVFFNDLTGHYLFRKVNK